MSEYIITVRDDADPDGWHRLTKPAEPLVRCRDCRHYTDDDMEYCRYCGSWCEQVEPDGFCWNAERKEDGV